MEGDVWYRCQIHDGLFCRGSKQSEVHGGCMVEPVVRNAGLEDRGEQEHAAPYYPPRAEAQEIADFLAAFADRYPHMWPTTRRKILWAAESLRYQVQHGYVGRTDG